MRETSKESASRSLGIELSESADEAFESIFKNGIRTFSDWGTLLLNHEQEGLVWSAPFGDCNARAAEWGLAGVFLEFPSSAWNLNDAVQFLKQWGMCFPQGQRQGQECTLWQHFENNAQSRVHGRAVLLEWAPVSHALTLHGFEATALPNLNMLALGKAAAVRFRGMLFSATENDVRQLFVQYGVEKCMKDVKMVPKLNGKPSGQAIVRFQ